MFFTFRDMARKRGNQSKHRFWRKKVKQSTKLAVDIRCSYLHHGMDVTLWSCELCRIFHLLWNWSFLGSRLISWHLDQDDEPQIVPHVMLLVDMILRWKVVICSLAFNCTSKVTFLLSKSFLSRPQIKHVFFLISSVLCFSDLDTPSNCLDWVIFNFGRVYILFFVKFSNYCPSHVTFFFCNEWYRCNYWDSLT